MFRATRLWHPFADMARVNGHELVFSRGQGCYVWDEDGNRYLDATASLWYCNVGYGRAEIADRVAEQLRQLCAYSAYGHYSSRPALELAERVAMAASIPDAVVFFSTSGSDAIDSAAKIARRYWQVVGQPQRQLLVALEGAYHGMNGFGTSLAGIPANARGYGELVREIVHISRDDPDALRRVLDENGRRVAAFFAEPVIGAGGVYPPSEEYLETAEAICREFDILFVLDEIVTGFGRLGRWFGAERFSVVPDMIVMAKGLTSGYVPLSGVICGSRIQEPFWGGTAGMLRHGYTYSAHPAACAAGLANLDIMERERLVDRSAAMEETFGERLRSLAELPGVAEVRSIGLMAAVELERELLEADSKFLGAVVEAAQRHGVLTRGLADSSLQISPPLVIERGDIEYLVEALSKAISVATEGRAFEPSTPPAAIPYDTPPTERVGC